MINYLTFFKYAKTFFCGAMLVFIVVLLGNNLLLKKQNELLKSKITEANIKIDFQNEKIKQGAVDIENFKKQYQVKEKTINTKYTELLKKYNEEKNKGRIDCEVSLKKIKEAVSRFYETSTKHTKEVRD